MSFVDEVRDKFAFLLTDHAFHVTRDDPAGVVLLESPTLCVEAVSDPRGEVAVNVYRLGKREHGMWAWAGMVGRASVPRLLEIAAERLREDGEVLNADAAYYDNLAADQHAASVMWTAYYSGRGPRPNTRHLP